MRNEYPGLLQDVGFPTDRILKQMREFGKEMGNRESLFSIQYSLFGDREWIMGHGLLVNREDE
jgi:hypothetical protein